MTQPTLKTSRLILRPFCKGEIGYWIGIPYWNLGYATEATTAALDYGFSDLVSYGILREDWLRR